jgi:YegS/Rv2252/BmrU family lipid kinase
LSLDGNPYAGRHLVVLNPAAGQQDPARVRRQLGGAFAVRGAAFDIVETAGQGDAERFARRGAELGYRAVVAVGGDGTVGEVITGLAGTDVPLALVPRGTGNQVAHNLGIPRALDAAVEVAVNGRPVPLDVGQLDDGRYFALAAGAGLDAEVIAAATRKMKDRWGFGAYLLAGLRVGVVPRPALYRITADDETLEVEASMVLAANVGQFVSPYFPVGVSIGPAVSFSDGLLDVCIFAPRTVTDMAGVLWRVASGRYAGDDRMIYLQAREVRIESDPPVVTQVDGELVGQTPLVARAIAAGAYVLVPR